MQHGMLFNSLSSPVPGVDVEQMICSLSEPVDPSALRRAWNVVAARHAILRTQFRWTSVDDPVQEVCDSVDVPFAVRDLRDVAEAEARAEIEAFLTEDRRRGFRLDEAPLMRLCLFRMGESTWELVWTFHHAILDGRSFPLVLREVFAAIEDGWDHAAPTPRAYGDYIQWLHRGDAPCSEAFWREQLRGFTAPTPLGGARPASDPAPSFRERELRLSG
ncbi:MAG: non-ribosomal peptide synthetase, partial [Polyangiaceae bacterium]|nr:non-ribosomal peptide synthetase [Polyangiaceae bacterium]